MRISTTQIYTQGVQAFSNQQVKLATLQQQISSGVRITKPSDDPAASARVLELQQSIQLYEQYQRNIITADNRLSLQDSTLSGAENLLQRIRELALQGNNDNYDLVDRQAIAAEIDQLRQGLISIANTTNGDGEYLFAGFQNAQQPFTPTTTGSISHVVFNGDNGQRSLQISQSRQVNVDTSGLELFVQIPSSVALNEFTGAGNAGTGVMAPAHVFDHSVYVPGDYQIVFTAANTYDVIDLSGPTNIVTGATYTDSQNIDFQGIRTSITGTPAVGDTFTVRQGQYQDLFTSISALVDTFNDSTVNSTQRNANVAQALQDIDAGFEQLINARTRIGGRLNALDSQKQDNEAFILSNRQTLSTLRDTDLASAISQLTLEQATLDAAQSVFARLTRSSLFNFLR